MNRRRKRMFLTLMTGAQKLNAQAQAFIDAVQADGGFFVASKHIQQVFKKQKFADILSPMNAEDEDKLYFWKGFYQVWFEAVLDDGGFVANEAHAKTVIDTFINASLACPMVAGDDGKLYFRSN